MRYRARAGKIKYEHAMIKGLRELLESLQRNSAIKSMIPSEIRPVKKFSQPTLTRLTPTGTGFKVIYHSGGAVQDVFFVGEHTELEAILMPLIKQK